MKKASLFILFVVLCFTHISAQQANIGTKDTRDSVVVIKKEAVKKGMMYIPLPVFQFNTDKGAMFGLMMSVYNFGDGQYYPNTKSNIDILAQYSTKGSLETSIKYDNKYMFTDTRLIANAAYKYDKCYQFYGFNGYKSYFDNNVSKTFYYFDRRNILAEVNILRDFKENLKWKLGYSFNYFDNRNADLNNINKGKSKNEQFLGETLFEKYRKWGLISGDQAEGGIVSKINFGLRYDTRDQEAAPQMGIFAEADIEIAPKFLGTKHPYSKYEINWRQYIPLYKERLIFAYKLNYMGLLGENVPYYAIPPNNTVRGILINRIQSQDIVSSNLELRYLFPNVRIFKQNIAFGLNAFFDTAKAMREYKITFNGDERYRQEYEQYISMGSKEKWHSAAGFGFQVLINRNFIMRFEYGVPFNKQDNYGGSFYATGAYHF